MNKFLIGLIVVVIGVLVGWYAYGGKLPGGKKLSDLTTTQTTETAKSSDETTDQKAGTDYQFTETSVTGMPPGSGADKGGVMDNTTNPQGTNVSYSDAGFSPAVMTVKVNSAVLFTNNSQGQMWVASAPHPAHTDLPGFDQKKSVGNGGSYSYTFSKIGTWKYHNHEKPEMTGIVVVTK